jgi:hypothetical protein
MLLQDRAHAAGGSGVHLHPGRRQYLCRIGPQAAGKDHLHAGIGHDLGGLNPGPARISGGRVFEHLKAFGCRIDNDKTWAAPETRVNLRIQITPRR